MPDSLKLLLASLCWVFVCLSSQAQLEPQMSGDPLAPLPTQMLYQMGALDTLPGPVLLPAALPEAFTLLDVRLQSFPNARFGIEYSYALVFAAGDQSFMLQSRLPGYDPTISPCGSRLIWRSRPLWLRNYAFQPQVVDLISPACSVTGELLTKAGIEPDLAESIRTGLRWYLPNSRR